MGSSADKERDIFKETLSLQGGVNRLPLVISLLFLLATSLWILFEHSFLPWSPISKDFFWAILSAGVLYLLLRYGTSVIGKSKEALRESEDRLARILETSTSGILVVDRKGNVTYANREAAALLGARRSDIMGRSFQDGPWKFPETDGRPHPAGDFSFVQGAMTGEASHGVERAVMRQDGTRVTLSFNTAPLIDAAGNPSGMVASFFDITAIKEAEELQLRKLSLAIDQSPSAIMITDRNNRVEYVNRGFTRMTGYAPEEVLGETAASECEHPPGECDIECGAVMSGERERVVRRGKKKNGEPYWETIFISPIRDRSGAVTNYLWIREDITERKRSESAIRESAERYQNLVENIHDLVWEADRDARFTYVSPRIRPLLGYDPGEVVGKVPFDLMPELEAGRVRELVAPVMAEGRAFEHIENIFRHRNGAELVFTTSGTPVHGPDGSFRGWRGVSRDITARVRAEEEARARQTQVIHSNRMASLGTLVSGVSHEINNPNNLIMFNAPIIRAAWRDAERVLEMYYRETGDFSLGGLPYSEMRGSVPKLITGISESSERIRKIVEKLKDFSRRDKEKLDCEIDLNEVVRAAIAILGHEIEKGCRNFHLDLDENVPMLKGCAQQLEQVVINLILNSLQALPDSSKGIRVSTLVGRETGRVEVSVRDEGSGMTPEVKRRCSEPFFSTKLASGGLGLGLSISLSIIRDHNGTLDFESEPGKGTTARIILPSADHAMEGSPKVSIPRYFR